MAPNKEAPRIMLLRAVSKILLARRHREPRLDIRCAVTASTWGDHIASWARRLPRIQELPAEVKGADRSWAAARYWRLRAGPWDEATDGVVVDLSTGWSDDVGVRAAARGGDLKVVVEALEEALQGRRPR